MDTTLADTADWLRIIAASRRIEDLAKAVFKIAAGLSLSATAAGMLTGPKSASGDLFYFNDWPASWVAVYRDKLVLGRDPIVRWALSSGAPITWGDLKARMDPTDPDHLLFELAAAHGYSEGYVLPVRTAAGHLGLLSMAGSRPPLLPDQQTLLQVVGTAALNRAEALDGGPSGAPPKALTPRERDCVALLVRGRSETEIAKALGISSGTARFHLDNARLKMRASSRAHLAELMTGAMQDLPDPPGSGGSRLIKPV